MADYISQTFNGNLGRDITLTPEGLIAAAHRRGAGAVAQYVRWQVKNGWKGKIDSDPELLKIAAASKKDKTIPDLQTIFREIETRLREFQDTPFNGPGP